jgi:hypothetical protein
MIVKKTQIVVLNVADKTVNVVFQKNVVLKQMKLVQVTQIAVMVYLVKTGNAFQSV